MSDVPTFTTEREPVPNRPFALDGTRSDDGQPWSEQFAILGNLPQGVLGDAAAGVTVSPEGVVGYSTVTVLRFIRGAIVPEDEARFEALIRDKHRDVELEVLGGVMLWALGQVTEPRPTAPPSTSTDGGRPTGTGSEDEPSGPDAAGTGSTD